MQTNRIWLILICCLLLTGCIKTKILDDVELIMTFGYDWDPATETYKGSAVAPVYGRSEQTEMGDNISYTGNAKTFQDINAFIQTEAPFQVEIGNIIAILFGEELMNKGIEDILYGINEVPDLGRDISVAIVQGDAETLLKADYNMELTLSRFIEKLIENNSKSNIPKMNLHQFNYRLVGEGMDPFLPILKQSETSIDIAALGMMKDDKLVHQIPYERFFVFKLLYEDCEDHTYEFEWEEKKKTIAISSIRSTRSLHWKSKGEVVIKADISGTLTESKKGTIKTFAEKKELEQAVSKTLQEEGHKLIQKFQELEIDPLMIGASAKSKFRDWKPKEWESQYPEITITPDVSFELDLSNIVQ
ncbi:Ger(x)C family spore germination protein [Gracilibacillus salitolerans]|uniref:Ger(X)C family spore germination protein n=1 Tax=Gracilibacillus salitolerans TaxID=2663022 RepID=A0A5Q2TJ74_9BACI|nr:Ger(x)C family spore germination protein [Gracilibacillus salitolerans]QGH34187.1 Ger(x)C family spore germination protein [Gracilibacillus salitolerans]